MAKDVEKPMPSAFYAFPSEPKSCGAAAVLFCGIQDSSGIWAITPWTKICNVGKRILHSVTAKIDECDILIADTTGYNYNVLFEVGFALGRRKFVWFVRDRSRATANSKIAERFRSLRSVSYFEYANHSDLHGQFARHFSQGIPKGSLFDTDVYPHLSIRPSSGVLYLMPSTRSDGHLIADRALEARQWRDMSNTRIDPTEYGQLTLFEYVKSIANHHGVLFHLLDKERDEINYDNMLASLLMGYCHAIDKPMLILAEKGAIRPLDYDDLLSFYESPSTAQQHVEKWVPMIHGIFLEDRKLSEKAGAVTKAISQLSDLNLGEFVAEAEIASVQGETFVDTPDYLSALSAKHLMYVGKKGIGKTANAIKISSELKKDKRFLVIEVSDTGYDDFNLCRIVGEIHTPEKQLHAYRAAWKYLFMGVAVDAVVGMLTEADRGGAGLSQLEHDFISFAREHFTMGEGVTFAQRVEFIVAKAAQQSVEKLVAFSQSIHNPIFPRSAKYLSHILQLRKKKLRLIVDNLDKSFSLGADKTLTSDIANMLVGAVDAAREIARSIRSDAGECLASPTIFLREDVYNAIRAQHSEADKLDVCMMRWTGSALVNVLERRIEISGKQSNPTDAWSTVFDSPVNKDRVLKAVLPRPRDVLQFARCALRSATGARHALISEDDVTNASNDYSSWAYSLVAAELAMCRVQLDEIATACIGRSHTISREDLQKIVLQAIPSDSLEQERIIDLLLEFGFLGIKSGGNEHYDLSLDKKTLLTTAMKRTHGGEIPSYVIHPAFRPLLDVL